MSLENPFHTSTKQEESSSAKEKFVSALDTVLEQMQVQGVLSPEQVADKKQAAQLIEEGFSENPQQDAEIFAHAGISDEKTMVELFERQNANQPTEAFSGSTFNHEDHEQPQREAFLNALDVVLTGMQSRGEISADVAAAKKEAAQKIEEGFSEDPQQDAELFAHAGVSDEKTLVGLLEKRQRGQ